MITTNLNTYKAIIKAPMEKVWHALTDRETVKQYFFGTHQQSTYKVGDPITWDGEFDGKKYHDQGVILESDAPNVLAYSYLSSWSGREDKDENYLYVKYELKVAVTETVTETVTELTVTFSSYDEEGAKHSEGSWKMLIDEMRKLIE
ncbi:MAG: SRPBCC domain-containing protein [Bacteroidetes bacterium]|nr:SRPBCC domain-containing protein [Bacteroidota bacterium]